MVDVTLVRLRFFLRASAAFRLARSSGDDVFLGAGAGFTVAFFVALPAVLTSIGSNATRERHKVVTD